ncbi:threonine/serine exporter family protein [Velocimicrobium porci]|uniref:threonine/serine ThrE exporter family protein n=1 Tax=Velocimicrobium porci TaxID=2606634 RepID=UPI00197BF878|nr:threonine/serine exporter family protein [Velocimicrobium porci]
MKLEEVLDTAILVGYNLLRNGAEIYRVEQSIVYICTAYGMQEIEAFAIPSSIVVTISDGRLSMTKSKRVLTRDTDLDKVDKLTDLSRKICRELPDYDTFKKLLQEILNGPIYGKALTYFAHAMIGLSFTLFFGGNYWDGLVGGMIGFSIALLTGFMKRLRANLFFNNILCGFFSAFISNILAIKTGLFHADKIIIGTIMLLVPGLALANSMRDFISSDTMTGLSRLVEALFVAMGIAIGVAFAMKFV